jgi:DNA-binding LytR/AlgR family response regulator
MSGGMFDFEALAKLMTANAPKKDYKEKYIVRFNDRIIPLQTSVIAFIYSEEKNNYLTTFDGEKYIIDSSLDVISEELNPDKFFRISRSCIVNTKAIQSIIKQAGGRLLIKSNPPASFEMTVSRSRVDDFLDWLER